MHIHVPIGFACINCGQKKSFVPMKGNAAVRSHRVGLYCKTSLRNTKRCRQGNCTASLPILHLKASDKDRSELVRPLLLLHVITVSNKELHQQNWCFRAAALLFRLHSSKAWLPSSACRTPGARISPAAHGADANPVEFNAFHHKFNRCSLCSSSLWPIIRMMTASAF